MPRDILLEYTMPITVISPIPNPSTDYLRRVLCVVSPKDSSVPEDVIVECTTIAEVQALTDSSCSLMLADMPSIYVLPVSGLDLTAILEATEFEFFTILIDHSFADVSGLVTTGFNGVRGWASSVRADLKAFAALPKSCGFYTLDANTGANMYVSFAKLLSASAWRNQQYISLPVNDEIANIGLAEGLYNDRISFALASPQYFNRLAFFAAGGEAIVAPYIYEEIELRLQGWALQYIALNQPSYNNKQASLLETDLQRKVNEAYENVVEYVTVNIQANNDNFIASGVIAIARATALWRVRAEVQEGLQ